MFLEGFGALNKGGDWKEVPEVLGIYVRDTVQVLVLEDRQRVDRVIRLTGGESLGNPYSMKLSRPTLSS